MTSSNPNTLIARPFLRVSGFRLPGKKMVLLHDYRCSPERFPSFSACEDSSERYLRTPDGARRRNWTALERYESCEGLVGTLLGLGLQLRPRFSPYGSTRDKFANCTGGSVAQTQRYRHSEPAGWILAQ